MGTRMFTAEELHTLGVPHDHAAKTAVADFHVVNGSWNETRRCVFADAGTFWAVDYERGLTEHQDVVNHGWGPAVEATEVAPVRIPTLTWVPADASVQADPAVDIWIVDVLHTAGRFQFSYREDELDLALERLHERRELHPDAVVRLVRMTTTYTVVDPEQALSAIIPAISTSGTMPTGRACARAGDRPEES
jgi:hypothetical protein